MGKGAPNLTKLNEDIAARPKPISTAPPVSDPADGGDSSLSLEERSKKALECPCVADLVNGPCGEQFSKAFGCFFKSQKPNKGSDCVEPYEKMQWCMTTNAGEFTSSTLADAHNTAGGHAEEPPAVPEVIRFPPWYSKSERRPKPKTETPT